MKFVGKMVYECDPDSLVVNMMGDSDPDDFQKANLEVVKGRQKVTLEYVRDEDEVRIYVVFSDGVKHLLL